MKDKWKDEFVSDSAPIGSQELKNLRSVTPMGFSIAFYRANQQKHSPGVKGHIFYK